MHDLNVYKQKLSEVGYADQDAAILLMRLQLILAIKAEISKRDWSQREAAKQMGVAQPRIAELVGLRVDKFTVELLTKYLSSLKKEVTLKVS